MTKRTLCMQSEDIKLYENRKLYEPFGIYSLDGLMIVKAIVKRF